MDSWITLLVPNIVKLVQFWELTSYNDVWYMMYEVCRWLWQTNWSIYQQYISCMSMWMWIISAELCTIRIYYYYHDVVVKLVQFWELTSYNDVWYMMYEVCRWLWQTNWSIYQQYISCMSMWMWIISAELCTIRIYDYYHDVVV